MKLFLFILVVCLPALAYASDGPVAAVSASLVLQMVNAAVNSYVATEIHGVKKRQKRNTERIAALEDGVIAR
jgi:hypothetical protein